jgi:chromosome segregation ATPase
MNIKEYIKDYLGINKQYDNLTQQISKLEKELIEIDNNNSSNANELYDIQHKVSYYDDYDLEVMSSENTANSNAINSLEYQFGQLQESLVEVQTKIGSAGGTNVEQCVQNEIEKYTVVVASSLQRKV